MSNLTVDSWATILSIDGLLPEISLGTIPTRKRVLGVFFSALDKSSIIVGSIGTRIPVFFLKKK